MSCCPPPCCVTPTCAPQSCCNPCYPMGGLGSLNSCCSPCGPSPCCSVSCCGSTSASSLGLLAGVTPACVNQIPPSEVVIRPSPVIVTIPGPILSATCEPVRVGGYTACGGSCCPPCGKIC